MQTSVVRARPGSGCSLFLLTLGLVCAVVPRVPAQAPLPIYTDHLVNGFQDWSWGTRNLANTSPVSSGTNSISLGLNQYQALSFHHSEMDTRVYANLTFWANGGANGGQRLQVYAEFGTNKGPSVSIGGLPTNAWRQYSISLASLGVANKSNFNRVSFQITSAGSNYFFVDDIQLAAAPGPDRVHLAVNAAQPVRPVDFRWFAVNAAVWDGNFDTSTTISLLREMGTRVMRFPGGSLSDEYHWASNKSGTNTWQWTTSFAKFAHVATNIGAQAFITVNYGSGTAAEAAGWVRHANITNRFGFKYWEIGNENYGTWETDTNARPHDPYTYAVRAADYFQQMKAADPTIEIGVVGVPGEDSNSNGYSDHPATNPRTGQSHNGWMPVMLTTLKNLGVTPDFIVHHRYPEWTDSANPVGSDSDAFLLQCSDAWAIDAANLRQQVSDYLGWMGTNVELVCTENNSDAGAQGRQSTSLINGLYYADSLGHLMQTEFNAFVWWDLRNGTDTKGCFEETLYGWRTYGDLGMVNGASTRHPTFYAAKLMQYFAQPGDTVLGATSDYPLLSVYAARRTNGALSVLVLNKDTVTSFTGELSLSGFVPGSNAVIRSYGIPQDEATRTNGPSAAQDILTNNFSGVSSNFTFSFPPASFTLFTLGPRPTLMALGPVSGGVAIRLLGQPGARYVFQSSFDLKSWTALATNTLQSSSLDITNSVAPNALKFWRAVWQP